MHANLNGPSERWRQQELAVFSSSVLQHWPSFNYHSETSSSSFRRCPTHSQPCQWIHW